MTSKSEYKNLSSNELTPLLNKQNITSVRQMIEAKKSSKPYFANSESVTRVITDIDHFPYTRYFRGVSYFPEPIVFEREAGWRQVENSCYDSSCNGPRLPYPNHCYETACSTTFPCYPPYFRKYSDRDALAVQLNKACIVQYR